MVALALVDRGVRTSTLGVSRIVPAVQAFVAIPGVVAVLDSVGTLRRRIVVRFPSPPEAAGPDG